MAKCSGELDHVVGGASSLLGQAQGSASCIRPEKAFCCSKPTASWWRYSRLSETAGDAMGLANEACIPCREGAPTLTEKDIYELLEELPGWEVVDHHHLRKSWRFTDFRSALDWVNRAGAICESQGHHAEFGLGWGHADAVIYTHKVDGLTRADAVLAARFEALDAKNPYGAFVTDR